MRLRGIKSSRNVQVRRGSGVRRGGGIGLVGVLAILAFGYFTGVDVTPLLTQQGTQSQVQQSQPVSAEDEQAIQFAAKVLTTAEEVWGRYSRSKSASPTNHRNWWSSLASRKVRVVVRQVPPDLFTARPMKLPILIRNSSCNWTSNWALEAILRQPM